VNAYEQLVAIRDQLELNGAHEDSVALVEKFIKRAESERESNTSVAQVMMLRHLLRQPEALDSDAIFNDLQELMDQYESRRISDDDVRPAYEDNERRPRPHSYYRSLRSRDDNKR
jgi:hypothetical protein